MSLAALGLWAWRTRRSQQQFRRLAETDALTGIPNRMSFTRMSLSRMGFTGPARMSLSKIVQPLN